MRVLRFEFDRYINGKLMAEGVLITQETNLADATRAAARIASRGPNGEAPVLVLNNIYDDERTTRALKFISRYSTDPSARRTAELALTGAGEPESDTDTITRLKARVVLEGAESVANLERALKAEAERDAVRKALEPLAVLEVPQRAGGNAGAYSIRHSDIERAKQLLATSEHASEQSGGGQ